MAPCGERLVTARLGRLGTPPSRHYDLGARSSLYPIRRELRTMINAAILDSKA